MYNSAKALLKGLQTQFAQTLANKQESVIKPFTDMVKSSSDKETYFLFDVLPGVREWVDEINLKDFNDFKYEIANKDWQNGTRVDRNTLSDSKVSLGSNLEMWVRMLSEEWTYLPDDIINDLLVANGAAFDGTAFFSNTRPNIQGTVAIDNLLTGTGTTLAQVNADLTSARTALRGFKDGNGKPFNRNLDLTIYAPAQLETTFKTLQNSELVDVGGGALTNIQKGTFNLVINDVQATTNNDWYAFNTGASFKPFIWQDRETPKFKTKDDDFKKYIDYAVTGRANAGYGNPMASVKVDN